GAAYESRGRLLMTDTRTGTIYSVGISGSKDSDAALLYMVYESGLPKGSIFPNFCDTGNECEETYTHVRTLSETVCVSNGIAPIEWLKPERDFYDLAEHKGRFPSAKARFCTEQLKIVPTMKRVKAWQDQGFDVVLVSGVRAGESHERGKLTEREYNTVYDCDMWRPLLTWSLSDVWAIHRKYKVMPNPLYSLGMKRVGCLPCVMSRKEELANIARVFPERIDRIREAEHKGKESRGFLSTFATPTRVPLRYRSQPWTHPKTGQQINLAMIDDVIRWAREEYDVEQMDLDLFDEPAACADRFGMCE
ncbi:MAG: phosphoadenosine phosphosulfate reductase family protein, partial [Armatimonadota bacterium]